MRIDVESHSIVTTPYRTVFEFGSIHKTRAEIITISNKDFEYVFDYNNCLFSQHLILRSINYYFHFPNGQCLVVPKNRVRVNKRVSPMIIETNYDLLMVCLL